MTEPARLRWSLLLLLLTGCDVLLEAPPFFQGVKQGVFYFYPKNTNDVSCSEQNLDTVLGKEPATFAVQIKQLTETNYTFLGTLQLGDATYGFEGEEHSPGRSLKYLSLQYGTDGSIQATLTTPQNKHYALEGRTQYGDVGGLYAAPGAWLALDVEDEQNPTQAARRGIFRFPASGPTTDYSR